MSKISDIYEQIKKQQQLLVITRLQETLKNSADNRELSEQDRKDLAFSSEELDVLKKLLKEQGLDFYSGYKTHTEGPTISSLVIKSSNKWIEILIDDWRT